MFKSKTTKLRHDPLESRGHLESVSKFGERLASDFKKVNTSSEGTKESCVQVISDEHSGFLAAFPSAKREKRQSVVTFWLFLVHRITQIRLSCPSQVTQRSSKLGAVSLGLFNGECPWCNVLGEPTLARRWPYNAQ